MSLIQSRDSLLESYDWEEDEVPPSAKGTAAVAGVAQAKSKSVANKSTVPNAEPSVKAIPAAKKSREPSPAPRDRENLPPKRGDSLQLPTGKKALEKTGPRQSSPQGRDTSVRAASPDSVRRPTTSASPKGRSTSPAPTTKIVPPLAIVSNPQRKGSVGTVSQVSAPTADPESQRLSRASSARGDFETTDDSQAPSKGIAPAKSGVTDQQSATATAAERARWKIKSMQDRKHSSLNRVKGGPSAPITAPATSAAAASGDSQPQSSRRSYSASGRSDGQERETSTDSESDEEESHTRQRTVGGYQLFSSKPIRAEEEERLAEFHYGRRHAGFDLKVSPPFGLGKGEEDIGEDVEVVYQSSFPPQFALRLPADQQQSDKSKTPAGPGNASSVSARGRSNSRSGRNATTTEEGRRRSGARRHPFPGQPQRQSDGLDVGSRLYQHQTLLMQERNKQAKEQREAILSAHYAEGECEVSESSSEGSPSPRGRHGKSPNRDQGSGRRARRKGSNWDRVTRIEYDARGMKTPLRDFGVKDRRIVVENGEELSIEAGQRLYRRGKEVEERIQKERESTVAAAGRKELKGCTFAPSLCETSKDMTAGLRPLTQRYEAWLSSVEESTLVLTAEQRVKDGAECTFKPKTNPYSAELVHGQRPKDPEALGESLHRIHERDLLRSAVKEVVSTLSIHDSVIGGGIVSNRQVVQTVNRLQAWAVEKQRRQEAAVETHLAIQSGKTRPGEKDKPVDIENLLRRLFPHHKKESTSGGRSGREHSPHSRAMIEALQRYGEVFDYYARCLGLLGGDGTGDEESSLNRVTIPYAHLKAFVLQEDPRSVSVLKALHRDTVPDPLISKRRFCRALWDFELDFGPQRWLDQAVLSPTEKGGRGHSVGGSTKVGMREGSARRTPSPPKSRQVRSGAFESSHPIVPSSHRGSASPRHRSPTVRSESHRQSPTFERLSRQGSPVAGRALGNRSRSLSQDRRSSPATYELLHAVRTQAATIQDGSKPVRSTTRPSPSKNGGKNALSAIPHNHSSRSSEESGVSKPPLKPRGSGALPPRSPATSSLSEDPIRETSLVAGSSVLGEIERLLSSVRLTPKKK
jgi:hypothetical protein